MQTIRCAMLLLLSLATPATWAESRRTPAEEAEFLMNQGLPFAEKMLAEYGEFFPFGTVMGSDGSVRTVGSSDRREQPAAGEVLEQLTDAFRAQASRGESRAVALFVTVRLQQPGVGEIEAVQVALEHSGGYCVNVFFPVIPLGEGMGLGEAFAGRRVGTVFDRCVAPSTPAGNPAAELPWREAP